MDAAAGQRLLKETGQAPQFYTPQLQIPIKSIIQKDPKRRCGRESV